MIKLDHIALQEIEDDHELFSHEIHQQLRMIKNKKLYHEKRKESDFVKHGRSENILYREQVTSLEETTNILEKDNQWLINAGDNNLN
jgi:hypothetical protein